jgi:hypothetical protein
MRNPRPIEDLDRALSAVDAGDTYATDEFGIVVRDEPRAEEELMKPWDERADAVRERMGVMASTPSP